MTIHALPEHVLPNRAPTTAYSSAWWPSGSPPNFKNPHHNKQQHHGQGIRVVPLDHKFSDPPPNAHFDLPMPNGPIGLKRRPAVVKSYSTDSSSLSFHGAGETDRFRLGYNSPDARRAVSLRPGSQPASQIKSPSPLQTGRRQQAVGQRAAKSKKRAVLVGVTYCGTKGTRRLEHSAKNVAALYDLLVLQLGFRDRDIWLLTDEPDKFVGAVTITSASRCNILNAMEWLVRDAKAEDQLVFSFSGNGSQVPNRSGGRVAWDDVILPSDHDIQPAIRDETIHNMLVRGLPLHATLIAIFDCRQSAGIMKLPFEHSVKRGHKKAFLVTEHTQPEEDIPSSAGAMAIILDAVLRKRRSRDKRENRKAEAEMKKAELVSALGRRGNVMCLSSCPASLKDKDGFALTSPVTNGLFTEVFVDFMQACISRKDLTTYHSALQAIAGKMSKRGGRQLPHFSCSSANGIESHISIL